MVGIVAACLLGSILVQPHKKHILDVHTRAARLVKMTVRDLSHSQIRAHPSPAVAALKETRNHHTSRGSKFKLKAGINTNQQTKRAMALPSIEGPRRKKNPTMVPFHPSFLNSMLPTASEPKCSFLLAPLFRFVQVKRFPPRT